MRTCAAAFALLLMGPPMAAAAPADDIADALVQDAQKPAITADSLPADFARLARFVRHDASGMILFTDGGSTDGYVRHAQAQFHPATNAGAAGAGPLFSVAIEFVDQPDFTFEALSAALAQRLGTPTTSANQTGATFRTWRLKQPPARVVTVARAQGSDNGDPITIVQITQDR